jgi:hypothetical protein
MSVLSASGSRAYRVRFNGRVNLEISRWIVHNFVLLNHGCSESIFSIRDVLLGRGDISIDLHVVVIKGILSDVRPFGCGLWGSHLHGMMSHGLSNVKAVSGSSNISVFTKVWDKVVNSSWRWVLSLSWGWSRMSILSASSGTADWVGLDQVSIFESDTKSFFSGVNVFPGGFNVILKFWLIVIKGIFSNIVPFSL